MRKTFLVILLALHAMLSCKSRTNSAIADNSDQLGDNRHMHSGDGHFHSVGGPLLRGYPWGLFDLQMQFQNRVNHNRNDDEMNLSNRIFEAHGALSFQNLLVSFPLRLEHQGYKPFGDGQSNAQGDFSAWPESSPPYIALLTKVDGENVLTILFHRGVSFSTSQMELKMPNNQVQTADTVALPDFYPQAIRDDYARIVEIKINESDLGWDTLTSGKMIFFRPKNWADWFATKFQNPYVKIDKMTETFPSRYRQYTPGENLSLSVPNPLKADALGKNPPLLQLMNSAAKSKYLVFTNDRVHSDYPKPGQSDTILKTVGGNWTFLLEPDNWEHGRSSRTFKQLYSCFAGRAYWEESVKKAISGTSWHHVGDPGEFLVNSVANESRSLITAIGEKVQTAQLPSGVSLAYNLDHVGYSGVLRPGFVFVSVNGQYHWHPVHVSDPVCIEVWTPFCAVSESSSYGMNCP